MNAESSSAHRDVPGSPQSASRESSAQSSASSAVWMDLAQSLGPNRTWMLVFGLLGLFLLAACLLFLIAHGRGLLSQAWPSSARALLIVGLAGGISFKAGLSIFDARLTIYQFLNHSTDLQFLEVTRRLRHAWQWVGIFFLCYAAAALVISAL